MKKLTAATFLCLFFLFAKADTFLVTSNLDNGPGTLREAITLANANGTGVADEITFSLSGLTEAARTIVLQSELPAVSGNLTIDGTTQNGEMFGMSNAKVILYLDHFTPTPFTFLFIRNASNVKIYGLCFKFFENPDVAGAGNYAILLRNSTNIIIGAPGKGNLFSAVLAGITNDYWNYYADSVRSVTVQGNVFGLSTTNLPVRRGYIRLIRATGITIGGASPAEGNLFVGASVLLSQVDAVNSSFFAKVQNNKFNLDWTGTHYYNESGNLDLKGDLTDDTAATKTIIRDNVFSSGWWGGIGLQHFSHKVIVQGNKLNTDITGTVCKGGDNSLNINQCRDVVVGGYQPEEENIFARSVYSQRHGVHFIKNQFGGIGITGNIQPGNPFIKILRYDNGLITGRANPNSKIQLYTNTCDLDCVNRKYFTTVYSNAAGDWQFAYTSAMPNIVATATTPDSSTSEFSSPKVNHLNAVVKQTNCGKSNGSITGIVIAEGTHIKWLDGYTLKVVSTDTNLVNVPAGSYVLTVSNGENGCQWSVNYNIYDVSPPPAIFENITNASCGKNNGSIYTTVPHNLAMKWQNAGHDSVGTGNAIYNLHPGTYYLKAWIPGDTSCNKTYGPYTIQNLSGPTLNTDNLQRKPATCSNSNGSITGLTATNVSGTPSNTWTDSLDNVVGNSYDLLNVPPGKYRLRFKDAGNCDAIVTPFYTVGNTGAIIIDTTGKIVAPAKCSGGGGSIQALQVAGGDRYEWKNSATGAVVASALTAYNLPVGTYQLSVSNQLGCIQTSPVVTIPQAAFQTIEVLDSKGVVATCGKSNGSVEIQRFSRDTGLYSFRWVDKTSGAVVGHFSQLYNIQNGDYLLFATDTNGCERQILSALLLGSPLPSFDYSGMRVKADQCLSGTGAIEGISLKNSYSGTTTYHWINAAGDTAGRTLNVGNLPPGMYRLVINNAGCTVESQQVTVNNVNITLVAPQYDEQTILKNTTATLTVKNPQSGTYQLFDTPSATIPLQQNARGIFSTPLLASDAVFYAQLINGVCASERVAVPVKVVDKTAIYVPTAFTPNGDGKNDVLKVIAYGKVKLVHFTVYNRWGGVVFSSSSLNQGWKGTVEGKPAQPGVYVWSVKAINELTGQAIEEKGTVTLIR